MLSQLAYLYATHYQYSMFDLIFVEFVGFAAPIFFYLATPQLIGLRTAATPSSNFEKIIIRMSSQRLTFKSGRATRHYIWTFVCCNTYRMHLTIFAIRPKSDVIKIKYQRGLDVRIKFTMYALALCTRIRMRWPYTSILGVRLF